MNGRHERRVSIDAVTLPAVTAIVCVLFALHKISRAVDAWSIDGWGVSNVAIWILLAVFYGAEWKRERERFIEGS